MKKAKLKMQKCEPHWQGSSRRGGMLRPIFAFLLFAFCIFNLSLRGAQMRFGPYTNYDGSLITNTTILVRPVGDPGIDAAGNVTAAIGLPLRVTVGADGMFTNALQPQNYFVTNALGGPAYFNKGYLFRAPFDTGPTVYSTTAPGILNTGMNYFVTLNAGTNGGGNVTFNNVTNALGGLPIFTTALPGLTNGYIRLLEATNVATAFVNSSSNSLYSDYTTRIAVISALIQTTSNSLSQLSVTNAYGTNAATLLFTGQRLYIPTNFDAAGIASTVGSNLTNVVNTASNVLGQLSVTNAYGTNRATLLFTGQRLYIPTNFDTAGLAGTIGTDLTNTLNSASNSLQSQIVGGAVTLSQVTNVNNGLTGVVGTNGNSLTYKFTSTGTNAILGIAGSKMETNNGTSWNQQLNGATISSNSTVPMDTLVSIGVDTAGLGGDGLIVGQHDTFPQWRQWLFDAEEFMIGNGYVCYGGGIVAGDWSGSTNSSASSLDGGISSGDFALSRAVIVQAVEGGIAGGAFQTASNVSVLEQYGSFAGGEFTKATNAGLTVRYGLAAVDLNAKHDVNIAATHSVIVGQPPSNYSNQFNFSMGVIDSAGGFTGISNLMYLGNGGGLSNTWSTNIAGGALVTVTNIANSLAVVGTGLTNAYGTNLQTLLVTGQRVYVPTNFDIKGGSNFLFGEVATASNFLAGANSTASNSLLTQINTTSNTLAGVNATASNFVAAANTTSSNALNTQIATASNFNATANATSSNFLYVIELPKTNGSANALTASNTTLLGNVAFGFTGAATNIVASTNVIKFWGAGSSLATNGVFVWNSGGLIYTNWLNGAYLTNNGSAWLMITNGVTLYSLAGTGLPVGGWSAVNGALPAPGSGTSFYFNFNGVAAVGYLSATNIASLSNQIFTNLTVTTTNNFIPINTGAGTNTTIYGLAVPYGQIAINETSSKLTNIFIGTTSANSNGIAGYMNIEIGGLHNSITDNSEFNNIMIGGLYNTIFAIGSTNNVILGGISNSIKGQDSLIFGAANKIVTSSSSVVLGGTNLTSPGGGMFALGQNNIFAAGNQTVDDVIIGFQNTISAYQPYFNVIIGTSNSVFGPTSSSPILQGSTAMGVRANASNNNVFIWSDGATNIYSRTNSSVVFGPANGLSIGTNWAGTNMLEVFGWVDSAVGFSVNGVPVTAGGGSGTVTSVNAAQAGYTSSGAVTTSGTITLTRSADIDELGFGRTNMSFLKVTNTAAIGGLATMNGLVLTNGFTNQSFTASTLLEADANKKAVSIANGLGALTNDNSGGFGYYNGYLTAVPDPLSLGQANIGTQWATNFVTPTNQFAGAIVDFSKSEQTTNLNGNITFTGIANATSGAYNYAVLLVAANGADRNVTVPSSWGVTPSVVLSSFTYTVTNGTKAEFLFGCQLGFTTNAAIRVISQ